VADVVAALVVADADSPLLAPGRCGSTPAIAFSGWLCAHSGHQQWRVEDLGPLADCYMCRNGLLQALPLWWDGALVPEGWARAVTVQWLHARSEVILAGIGLVMEPTPFQVEQVGLRLVSLRLASRIVLLARDNGRLVEVQP
jgi:hypothetical protein